MLDWVPEGHAVRVVIDTVERLMTRDLAVRLVPSAPKGPAAGPARYDPVMLLTVWMDAYLRGVLSTRAVEDRCRYDATFRVACGRLIPDHTTFSRFRRHLFAQAGLAEDLFYQVLHVCALAGLGRLGVVAGDGVKIAGNASKEASRTKAGLRKLAAQVVAGAREAAAADDADKPVLPGTDLLLGGDTVPPCPDPRSRAGRVLACLDDLQGEREAAEAAAPEQGRAYLEALEAGAANGRPPAAVALAAQQLRVEKLLAEQQAAIAAWQAGRAAGAGSQPGRRPADRRTPPGSAGPAPGWRTCRPPRTRRPPPGTASNKRPGSRSATSPIRTPGSCPSAAAGSSRAATARTPPTTGSCQAATPARTPATPCRHSGSPPSRRKAPRSARPPTPPTPATPPCSAPATTGCAPCRSGTEPAPATTPPPAMPP
jgi:transposase